MTTSETEPKNQEGIVILSITLGACLFFAFVLVMNLTEYTGAFAGAVFQLLMLPCLAVLLFIPLFIIGRFRSVGVIERRWFVLSLLFWAMPVVGVIVATVREL